MLTKNYRLTARGLIASLACLSILSIISTSYVGLNGNHVWRQADSYSQILGFIGTKGFLPLNDFYGFKSLYDFPLYQYCVAFLSINTGSDPLVASKYLNSALWLTLMYGAFRLAETLRNGSGPILMLLTCTSPLFIHYYTTPLPDNLSLSLAFSGAALVYSSNRFYKPLILITISALIKSPIAFVALTLICVLKIFLPHKYKLIDLKRLFTLLFFSFLAAVSAEVLRKVTYKTINSTFAQNPEWYFGNLELRLSGDFWLTIIDRLVSAFPYPWIAYMSIVSIPISLIIIKENRLQLTAILSAFFSGWLVFSNVYYRHDYYALPTTMMFFLASSISIQGLIDKLKINHNLPQKWLITSYIYNIMLISAIILLTFMPRISNLMIAGPFDGINHLLRDTKRLIWVNNEQYDVPGDGLPIGGLTMTKILKIKGDELESHCEKIISDNDAFLVYGTSQCLVHHKLDSRAFIDDDGYIFFLK